MAVHQFSKSGSCCFCVSLYRKATGSSVIVTKIRFLILGNGHTHGEDGFHFDACVIRGTPHSVATVDDVLFAGSGTTDGQRKQTAETKHWKLDTDKSKRIADEQ